jgi:hypothetical protein
MARRIAISCGIEDTEHLDLSVNPVASGGIR